MAANAMLSNSPFATYGQEQQSETTEENGSPQRRADWQTISSRPGNINRPPPAYFPSRNTQTDPGVDSPPPYEPRRDRPTYTDNVRLQDLRPLRGLDAIPVATTLTDNDTEAGLSDHPKVRKRISRRAWGWIVIFTILGVGLIVVLIMLLGKAII
ncbi:hypothetical protein V1525DRAFT_455503 [Lipomyces kononenkoae]|uniref:Uncharacterized protein n=1 Tax=Lipomyces kononenkoae TaxID=34357 RepID=A0ACC3T4C6_LIPKO